MAERLSHRDHLHVYAMQLARRFNRKAIEDERVSRYSDARVMADVCERYLRLDALLEKILYNDYVSLRAHRKRSIGSPYTLIVDCSCSLSEAEAELVREYNAEAESG